MNNPRRAHPQVPQNVTQPPAKATSAHHDELESQIELHSNLKKAAKLREQCEELELLVGPKDDQQRRPLISPFLLNDPTSRNPGSPQNARRPVPHDQRPRPKGVHPPSRRPGDQPSDVSLFEVTELDCLSAELFKRQRQLEEFEAILHQREAALKTKEQKPEQSKVKDSVDQVIRGQPQPAEPAKARERQQRFDNYLRAEFPQEVD